MAENQYTFDNPVDRYPTIKPDAKQVPEPGLESDLQPGADLGEESYVGSGRLTGRKAIVTGGDSGIGAATAIAFAREGADVAIVYLPDEEEDAQRIAGLIRDAGRTAVTIPGDLKDARLQRRDRPRAPSTSSAGSTSSSTTRASRSPRRA